MDEKDLIFIDALRRKYKQLYGRYPSSATLNRWVKAAQEREKKLKEKKANEQPNHP